jgi:hypothetical protein
LEARYSEWRRLHSAVLEQRLTELPDDERRMLLAATTELLEATLRFARRGLLDAALSLYPLPHSDVQGAIARIDLLVLPEPDWDGCVLWSPSPCPCL